MRKSRYESKKLRAYSIGIALAGLIDNIVTIVTLGTYQTEYTFDVLAHEGRFKKLWDYLEED